MKHEHDIKSLIEETIQRVLKKHSQSPEYMTTEEAARFLSMSTAWLEQARHRGEGPTYAKLSRAIRYSRQDLIKFMKQHQQ